MDALQTLSSKPLPPFDTLLPTPLAPRIQKPALNSRDETPLVVFPGYTPGAFSPARASAAPEPIAPSQYSLQLTPAFAGANERGDSNGSLSSCDEIVPPPVPPKSPVHNRPKSVNKAVAIVAPTDISPARRVFSHSVSDSGHYPTSTSPNFAAVTPDSAPARPISISSLHQHAYISTAATLSFASDASLARHSSMEPVTRHSSSIRERRNRLHKARPRPPSPLPASSSVFSLLSRALGSTDSHRLSSMDDRSYRPTRSLSDGSSKVHPTRPSPSSRSSETADSSCTASSSASTSLSYASTSLTTPDSSCSPSLSPRSSTRTNKLQKKRPTLAPSAYQYPPGAHHGALGRSKSTPNGLGQRVPRNRLWTTVEGLDAEDVGVSGRQDPSVWYASPSESSPSRRSNLGPIQEVRKRRSSQALSDLACTGLCSTSVAAHTSQLALTADSVEVEGLSTLSGHDWHDPRVEQFNPYMEYASSPSKTHDPIAFPVSDSSSSSSPEDTQEKSGESGFAVVHGYLDRSEDAMRRWTLAMADVPDDVLVQHLERLRKESVALARGRLPGRKSAAPSQVGHGDDEFTVDTRDRRSSFFFGGPREMGISPRSPSGARFSVGHYDQDLEGEYSDEEALSDEEDEEDWKTARQVLFCCRELVQTERNYQGRLRELASTELSHHYASLVSRFIPALLHVSETLLAHLIDDPSAWGVSAAFIGCEEELEAAFVAWSSVAGEFFLEDANLRPPRKLKKLSDDSSQSLANEGCAPSFSRIMRTRSQAALPASNHGTMASRRFSSGMSDIGHIDTSSSSGHAGAGMFTAALGTGLAYGLAVPASPLGADAPMGKASKPKSVHGLGYGGLTRVSTVSSSLGLSRAMTAWKRKSMPSSMSNIPSLLPTSPSSVGNPTHQRSQSNMAGYGHYHAGASSAHGHGASKKMVSEHDAKMTVRDLAIQPTQRVMRYVLQYRDLLDHTPASSPSRGLVERAYESALRIAKKCDRAQAHASFLRQSAANPKNEKRTPRTPTSTTNLRP